jgi:hypothetical protein
MGIYDSPIDRILPELMGGSRQAFSGVDPDWTALAGMYGFRPNPFPATGTQGQEEIRFAQALKSIMDQQLGGSEAMWNQISPDNPFAAMPNYMSNYFAGAAPLFNSPAAMAVMPTGTGGMFSGGYQKGPLPSSQSPLIQMFLAGLRGNQTPGSEGPPAIAGGTYNTGNPTSPVGANPVTQQISGGNTAAQTPPAANTGPSAPPANADVGSPNTGQSTGPETIRAAIAQPTNPPPGATGAQGVPPPGGPKNAQGLTALEQWSADKNRPVSRPAAAAENLGKQAWWNAGKVPELVNAIQQWDDTTRTNVLQILTTMMGGR